MFNIPATPSYSSPASLYNSIEQYGYFGYRTTNSQYNSKRVISTLRDGQGFWLAVNESNLNAINQFRVQNGVDPLNIPLANIPYLGYAFFNSNYIGVSYTISNNSYSYLNDPNTYPLVYNVNGNRYYGVIISANDGGALAEVYKTGIYADNVYTTLDEGLQSITITGIDYPITYRLTNTTPIYAPSSAAIGEIVNATFTFPYGYGIANPMTDIYVTNNGVIVPHTYSNGTLTFTMPSPS